MSRSYTKRRCGFAAWNSCSGFIHAEENFKLVYCQSKAQEDSVKMAHFLLTPVLTFSLSELKMQKNKIPFPSWLGMPKF